MYLAMYIAEVDTIEKVLGNSLNKDTVDVDNTEYVVNMALLIVSEFATCASSNMRAKVSYLFGVDIIILIQ